MTAYPTFKITHYPSAGPKGGWVSSVWYYHSVVQGHQLDLVWHQYRVVGRVWAGWRVLKALYADVRNRPVCWCEKPSVFEELEVWALANRPSLSGERRDDV